jgi:PPOX class probable F420-dependent enzyme
LIFILHRGTGGSGPCADEQAREAGHATDDGQDAHAWHAESRRRIVLTEAQAAFLTAQRVGRLATADAQGNPHVVPVCFAIIDTTLYVTIDEKPKRASARPLKRLRNMIDNPSVAFVADRYNEDWQQLGWVMLRGRVEILADGAEHDRAQSALRERYVQYRSMRLADLPVIALRIERVTAWGNLAVCPAG